MEWGLERKLTLQLRRAEGGMGKKSHGTLGGRLEIILRSLWEKEKSFTYSKNFNLRGLDMLLIVTVANDYIQRSFQLSTCLTRHFLGLCVHWIAGVITRTFTSFLVTAIILSTHGEEASIIQHHVLIKSHKVSHESFQTALPPARRRRMGSSLLLTVQFLPLPATASLVRDQRAQRASHFRLLGAVWRVVIHREHADGREAARVHDVRLARQAAVAVDAGVDARGSDVAVGEDLAGGVVDGGVGEAAAGEAGLDEWRLDAGVVGEGGDGGGVDADAVAGWEVGGAWLRAVDELVDDVDG